MGTFKLWRSIHHFFYGIPADEAAPCHYCTAPVAPHTGYRDNGDVFCNDECASLDFERAA